MASQTPNPCVHAATCLRRLAQEQDAAATRRLGRARLVASDRLARDDADAATLARHRAEAARAMGDLWNAIAPDVPEEERANGQLRQLRSDRAIPSATLLSWADAWERPRCEQCDEPLDAAPSVLCADVNHPGYHGPTIAERMRTAAGASR